MKIKSVDGAEADLLWSGSDYFIRIYNSNGLGFKDGFEDCKIKHSDLSFVINDEDAYLYEDDDGNVWIDHSPETLCLELKADDEEDAMINAFDEYLQSIREPIDPSRPKAIPHSDAEWEAWRHAWKKAKE